MRKSQKKDILDAVEGFSEFHRNIVLMYRQNNIQASLDIISACQDGAIQIGNLVDKSEGEGTRAVKMLEQYCEAAFQLYQVSAKDTADEETISTLADGLDGQMHRIGDSIRDDIVPRLEIAFLPYNISMWDSLESIYEAAKADDRCDVHLVPIPYYDKNSDGTMGEVHYDGESFPKEETVTFFKDYDLSVQRPDVIFIHNPYDEYNNVTSVFPQYYSHELKKYTECLVYVPYYATAGGMNSVQSSLSAYYYADYIVVQSKQHIDYFDSEIPREKFIIAGSPKFDHVIHECSKKQHVPETWEKMIRGRKVIFYNTSITGMLYDTELFLKKIEYVINTFKGRDDVCLLWRPHPLLDATFDSMRPQYKIIFDKLKEMFIGNNLGIYDDTPDIANSIAISDAYIGDSGTSVISLFGITGKPIFILDNLIHELPSDIDWQASVIEGDYAEWALTDGNQLFHSEPGKRDYRYVCRLSEYGDRLYGAAFADGNRAIITPTCAQNILIVEDGHVNRKIELVHRVENPRAFYGACETKRYVFLVPLEYPAIVRFDKKTDMIDYLEGFKDIFAVKENGEWKCGGMWPYRNMLLLTSPQNQTMLAIDIDTLETQLIGAGDREDVNCMSILPDTDGSSLWMLPYTGTTIRRWNPITGECRYFDNISIDQQNKDVQYDDRKVVGKFSGGLVYNGKLILSQNDSPSLLSVDIGSGRTTVFKTSFKVPETAPDSYFSANNYGMIYRTSVAFRKCCYFSFLNKKVYNIDLKSDRCEETEIKFDKKELQEHEYGFCDAAPWNRYFCKENVFNSLEDFLDDNISGGQFDKETEMKSYGEITENPNGTSGQKIWNFVVEKNR